MVLGRGQGDLAGQRPGGDGQTHLRSLDPSCTGLPRTGTFPSSGQGLSGLKAQARPPGSPRPPGGAQAAGRRPREGAQRKEPEQLTIQSQPPSIERLQYTVPALRDFRM